MTENKGKTAGGIHYQVLRSGAKDRELLLLIMGYSGSMVSWSRPFVDDLLQTFDLVLVDNRGTGHSFHPASIDDITVPAMAEDVWEVVQHLQLPRFNLLGYSLGGCIAQQFAAHHPDQVKHLVLLSTTGGGSLYVPPGQAFLGNLQNPSGATPWEMALAMWGLCLSADAIKEHEELLKVLHEQQMEKATPRRTFAGQMRAFRSFATERLERPTPSQLPVTIISGKNDRLMPHGNSLKLHEFFNNSRLIEIEACEHMPYIETKDVLVRALQTSLQT